MATTVNFDTAKKSVTSQLQASLTAFGSGSTGSTPDGSNAMFRSATEIDTAILTADFEIATLIANTPQSPFQTTFIQTSSALTGGASNLPARNGMILQVTGMDGTTATNTFVAASISTVTNLVTSTAHGFVTGQKVQIANPGTLPTPLAASTNYYIYAPTVDTYGFATTIYNAKIGTIIDITNIGSGTNTVTTQYVQLNKADTKDTIVQVNLAPYLFAEKNGVNAGWYFIEGDIIYYTSVEAKVIYTDTTLTSSPQSPEPYTQAVISGALMRLTKDGGDSSLFTYHERLYKDYLSAIAQGAKILPDIQAYGV